MSIAVEEMFRTRKKLFEAFQQVDWQTLALQILQAGPSSSPASGPANSWISTIHPRVLPVKPDHSPKVFDGEEAELLKDKRNWPSVAMERKLHPFLSSDEYTARAQTDVSSLQPLRIREVWYKEISQMDDIRKILRRKRGEQIE